MKVIEKIKLLTNINVKWHVTEPTDDKTDEYKFVILRDDCNRAYPGKAMYVENCDRYDFKKGKSYYEWVDGNGHVIPKDYIIAWGELITKEEITLGGIE